MSLKFGLDPVGSFFLVLFTCMWIVSGVYAAGHGISQTNKKRFWACYVLTYIMLACLCVSQSYLTMYLSFVLMSILAAQFVCHDGEDLTSFAAVVYLVHAAAGAVLGIPAFFILKKYCGSQSFAAGGSLTSSYLADTPAKLLVIIFLTILAFSTAAGIFPFHSWIPEAQPSASAPVSAALSGVVTKASILCVIRVIFFVFGADVIRGSWVQYVLSIMALLTIIMGSVVAYQQKFFARRLAYSSVGQLSYILFGIFSLGPVGLLGAFLHIVYHSLIKSCMYMATGAIMAENSTQKGAAPSAVQRARSLSVVSSFEGLGLQMPFTFGCIAVCSFGLIGIPPVAGFLSRWYLATGSLAEGLKVISWLGPAVMLLSALVISAYLFPVLIHAYFPTKETPVTCGEAGKGMLYPAIFLAIVIVLLGIFAQPLVDIINGFIPGLF